MATFEGQPVVAIRWYHSIPGPFARHIVAVLADSCTIHALHLAFGGTFRPLFDWTEAQATTVATERGATDLPALDPIRPSGHEFTFESLADLLGPPADQHETPADLSAVEERPDRGVTVAEAIAQVAERDERTPEPLRSKQITGQPWHNDEDADYVLFGTH
jgi:hypothetical protein